MKCGYAEVEAFLRPGSLDSRMVKGVRCKEFCIIDRLLPMVCPVSVSRLLALQAFLYELQTLSTVPSVHPAFVSLANRRIQK
jgi:hypothetical protein